MPQPTSNQVHVNKPLTNISLAYMQKMDSFVSRRVFPVVPVENQSDIYYEFAKKQWFRSDVKVRAPGTESVGSGYDVNPSDPYFCAVRALHKNVDDQVKSNADSQFNLEKSATEFVTRQMMLDQELDWAKKYFTTGVWKGSSTGTDITVSTLWDAAGSDPISDMENEITAVHGRSGMEANKIVFGYQVWKTLKHHPDIIERIKYTHGDGAKVTMQLIASLLEVDEVLVSKALHDTTQEGGAETLDYVCGKDVLICYANPTPSLMMPSAGYTFAWRGFLGSNAAGMRIKRFRMEHLSADRVEGESAYDHKIIADDCGAFLSGVIS